MSDPTWYPESAKLRASGGTCEQIAKQLNVPVDEVRAQFKTSDPHPSIVRHQRLLTRHVQLKHTGSATS